MVGMEHLFVRAPDFGCLSGSEARRAKDMGERRRDQFVLGRTALRTLAGRILGVPASEVPLSISASGAPFLIDGAFHVSVSHSGGGALAVIAGARVGCDLETLQGRAKDFTGLAERFYHPAEAEAIRDASPEERQPLFLAYWTRKEAAFKCGILDWSRCLRHAWREGDNVLESGTMSLGFPEGLTDGWIGSLALWLPRRSGDAQRPRMGNLDEPPSHERT